MHVHVYMYVFDIINSNYSGASIISMTDKLVQELTSVIRSYPLLGSSIIVWVWFIDKINDVNSEFTKFVQNHWL